MIKKLLFIGSLSMLMFFASNSVQAQTSGVPGCFLGAIYSPTTGQLCQVLQAGCNPGAMFNYLDGSRCSGNTIPQPVPPIPGECFPRTLSIGSQGDDVRRLQQFLVDKGFLTVAPTGYFGDLTHSAFKKWQNVNMGYVGVILGIFDEQTRIALNIQCNLGNNNTSPIEGQ